MNETNSLKKDLIQLVKSQKKKNIVNSIRIFIVNKLKDCSTSEKIQVYDQIENKYIQSAFIISLIQALKYPDDLEVATELIKNNDYADVREACIQHIRLKLFIDHMDKYDRFHNATKEISIFKWGGKENPELFQFVLEYEIENSISFSKEKQYSTIIEVPELDLAEERANEFSPYLLTT